MSDIDLLLQGCEQLSLSLNDTQVQQLTSYIEEISLFNETYKLVAATKREFVIKHLLDSLVAATHIRTLLGENKSLADLGSGGGLPGIPLAIVLEDVHVTLIERSSKRVDFLHNAIAMCNLTDRVVVHNKDLFHIDEAFDVVTFRALSPFIELYKAFDSLVKPGGVICAYKGLKESAEREVEELRNKERLFDTMWSVTYEHMRVPFLEGERTLVVLHKQRREGQ